MLLFWVLFNVFALGLLVIDLQVFHRPGHVVRFQEALAWSAMYIALAGGFAILLLYWQGHHASLEFVTGYVLELSLSVDNLFVFLVIFKYFAVPEEQQHRVLFWGIIGALVLRGIFIGAGVGLINRFHWVLYLFGGLLVYSGIRLFWTGDRQVNPEKNPVVKTARRLFSVTSDYRGGEFFVRVPDEKGILHATPLLIVLLVIETTDLLFAVDSIPAILAITLKAFIVYTSNVFAILGLRSMYFAVAGLMKIFRFLSYGLSVILVFVGAKMLLQDYFEIPIILTLAIVGLVLLISIGASLGLPEKAENKKG